MIMEYSWDIHGIFIVKVPLKMTKKRPNGSHGSKKDPTDPMTGTQAVDTKSIVKDLYIYNYI